MDILTFVALVLGPGSGVLVAMKLGQSWQQIENDRTYKTLLRIEQHLAILNNRVAKSEIDIENIEDREGREGRSK
jgi:hypothetical protein